VKLPAFDYAVPASLAEAVALLASARGEAKAIAGGQSLLPAMAFRLVLPRLLVDLRGIPGLDRIDIGPDGVRLGARVRWRDILENQRLVQAHPLLREAVSHVAHYQVRNRGTVGGSLAHADPAAEMPGIAVTCEASVEVTGPGGDRSLPASEFFTGPLSTALRNGELVVAVRLPAWRAGRRWAFRELARRRGDFALAGVALHYDLDRGRVAGARIGVIGVSDRPHRLVRAEAALEGREPGELAFAAAAAMATAEVDPPEDQHASAAYRRSLVGTLLERALREAKE